MFLEGFLVLNFIFWLENCTWSVNNDIIQLIFFFKGGGGWWVFLLFLYTLPQKKYGSLSFSSHLFPWYKTGWESLNWFTAEILIGRYFKPCFHIFLVIAVIWIRSTSLKSRKNPAVTHSWNKTDTQSSRRPDREILETDLITNISKASLITHFHIISIKFGFEYFCTVPVHFFGLRLYIHMVYITVSTSVNIRRMFSMTPTTLTASSQGRWHENEGFWRKTVPSVIMGCHFFFTVLRSRTSRPRRETAGRGWWQMDGFRGSCPSLEAGKFHLLRSRWGVSILMRFAENYFFLHVLPHIFKKPQKSTTN